MIARINQLQHIKTIAQNHRVLEIPQPEHPLLSVIDFASIKRMPSNEPVYLTFDFYFITINVFFDGIIRYGQQDFDFHNGVLSFMAPGQVLMLEFNHIPEEVIDSSGWMLLIHPEFLWNTSLANMTKQYEYFRYSVNEALHMSEKEEAVILKIIKNIEMEYHSSIDKLSRDIVISHLEVLFNYSQRYYQRQFITRNIVNHSMLERLEAVLETHFKHPEMQKRGIPTVQQIATSLSLSPNYLSGLLKTLTGQSTQQHIHNKLIDLAKSKLSITDLTVSEIAYELGFEHVASFSKLFRNKTNLTPLEFRASFS
jgi:AraC family transcriptional activator of pobA